MPSTKQDFELPAGDDIWVGFDIDPAELETDTLDNAEIIFAIFPYEGLHPDEVNPILSKSSIDNAVDFDILDAVEMEYRVRLNRSDSELLTEGIYYHKTQVIDSDGKYVTTTTGRVMISPTP